MQEVPGPDGYFGDAEAYDKETAAVSTAEVVGPIVDFLSGLAGSGFALELGIGTGRVAAPLAERGVPVHGIELSRPMAAKLNEKPGGATIEVTIGDFATTRVKGRTFSLVYLVFNTIMNLTTQDAQVACFANAADHLDVGGYFVIETVVPGLQRLAPGQVIQDTSISDNQWSLDEYDVVTQGLKSHGFRFTDEGVRHRSTPFRYVWPSELDLMARIAGMALRERWTGWLREPFTADSKRHVSVWQKG